MEEPKKTCNDQGKKRMTIKLGGGVGAGIGAVVLLATAALASAFVARRTKGRSSGKSRRRQYQSPPPQLNKLKNEEDEANEGQRQFSVLDTSSDVHKYQSNGVGKKVESEDDGRRLVNTSDECLALNEKPKIELNGGTPGGVVYDVVANELKLCSISPREKGKEESIQESPVMNDGELNFLDERKHLDSGNLMHESKIDRSNEENATDEILKENDNLNNGNQDCIEDEKVEGESGGHGNDGEIEEKKKEINDVEITDEMQLTEKESSEVYCDDQKELVHEMEEGKVNPRTNVNAEEEGLGDFCRVNGEISDEKSNAEEKGLEECDGGDDGEIIEEKCGGAVSIGSDLREEKTHNNEEVFGTKGSVSESYNSEAEEEEETLLPAAVPDVPVTEHELDGANGDTKEATEIVEIIQKDEAIERGQEDYVTRIEEELLDVEREQCNKPDEEINLISPPSELKVEVDEEKIPVDHDEEKACVDNPMLENKQIGDYHVNAYNLDMHEEKLISGGDYIEVAREDSPADVEIEEERENDEDVHDDIEKFMGIEFEDSSEPIDGKTTDQIQEISEIEEENGQENTLMKDYDEEEADETDSISDDEVEESSVETGGGDSSSLDSNSESIPDQQEKLIDRELEGKIQEDIFKLKQDNNTNNQTISENSTTELERVLNAEEDCDDSEHRNEEITRKTTFVDKYMIDVAMMQPHKRSSTRRKMVIGTLSILSSISCSWFFGLSFVKLCLLVLFSMALSRIHGY